MKCFILLSFPRQIKQRKCMVIIYSYFISCLVKIRLKIYAARNYFLSNENTLRANGSEAWCILVLYFILRINRWIFHHILLWTLYPFLHAAISSLLVIKASDLENNIYFFLIRGFSKQNPHPHTGAAAIQKNQFYEQFSVAVWTTSNEIWRRWSSIFGIPSPR